MSAAAGPDGLGEPPRPPGGGSTPRAPGAGGRAQPAPGEGAEPRSQRMAEQIEERASHPFPWKTVVKRSVVLVVAGVTIYLVFPSLTEVFGSWPKLSTLAPIWFSVAVACQLAHFVCTCWLQRIALRTKAWYSVVTAQLSGNAISLVVPGGAAAGAALQFRMLGTAGMDTTTAVGGLTAFSLLGVGGLLLLPVFVLPAILFGVPVNRSLAHVAFLGIGAFVLFGAFSAVVLATDRPLLWAGDAVEVVRNRVARRRHKPEASGTGRALLHERDRILGVLGRKWRQAALLSAGRLAFDFFTLLAALRATGARPPHPSLVLLAYALAGLLALIPITPGGLGIVEAGLAGLLVLAGVGGGNAVLATLAYRVISYWLPLLAGPVAYLLYRVRYGPPTGEPAVAVT